MKIGNNFLRTLLNKQISKSDFLSQEEKEELSACIGDDNGLNDFFNELF